MKKLYLGCFLITMFLFIDGSAFGFSCKDRIVSLGDTKAEVFMKCGEPAWKDTREEEIIEKIDAETTRKVFITIDEWTYNFGPNTLIRILKFANGKLADIKEGGYGYTDSKISGAHCDEKMLSLGDTKAEARIKCGEPTWKEERKEEIIESIDKDTRRKVTITIEEWTYNLGPNRFIRILKFRNGKLMETKTGDYGY